MKIQKDIGGARYVRKRLQIWLLNITANGWAVGEVINKLNDMENTLEKLIGYFEQQLKLQRESNIKYTGEEAYFDAVEVSKNALKSFRQPPVSSSLPYRKCDDCGTEYYSNGRCPECLPMG